MTPKSRQIVGDKANKWSELFGHLKDGHASIENSIGHPTHFPVGPSNLGVFSGRYKM